MLRNNQAFFKEVGFAIYYTKPSKMAHCAAHTFNILKMTWILPSCRETFAIDNIQH